jgi:hypothetical protein
MLKLGKRWESPPVIPGPDGATRPRTVPACVPCGTTGSGTRVPLQIEGGEWIIVCHDGHACAERYRQGASAESYAAGLRGEILGVAP